jgi:glycosyltransferase involved in cell wall biosynthesis
MRIAQVSSLWESVPPPAYGSTERILSYFVEELVKQGHEVTLYASGDSQTSAILRVCSQRAHRRTPGLSWDDGLQETLRMFQRVFAEAGNYDVVHLHQDEGRHFPYVGHYRRKTVTTMHYELGRPSFLPHFRRFQQQQVISISDAQREAMPWMNWLGTVYHGLPRDLYRPCYAPGSYLAYLGRIAPQKRPEWAIRLAKAVGIPLRIAARLDTVHVDDMDLRDKVFLPLSRAPGIEFMGEVGDAQKQELLAGAMALIFPIDWPEPFGLVMIEAMACGTPVIAWRRGSVPEVIDHGVTGFIVSDMGEAVAALRRIGDLDRRKIRAVFEQRFTIDRMARDYVRLYERMGS